MPQRPTTHPTTRRTARRAALRTGLILTAILLTGCTPDTEPQKSPAMAGGYHPAATDTPQVIAAARFAAAQIDPNAPDQRVQVLKARQQVVAGMNYELRIKLADGRVWDVAVFRDLDGQDTLTRSQQVGAPTD